MTRGRKAQKRSQLAAQRLEIARDLCGKSYEGLVSDPRWQELVNIFDPKTIRAWVKQGVPKSRVSQIAEYFRIPAHLMVDDGVSLQLFERQLYDALENAEGTGRSHLESSSSNANLEPQPAREPGPQHSIKAVLVGEVVAMKEKAQRYIDGQSTKEEMSASTPLLTSIATELVRLPEDQVVAYRRTVTLDMEMRKTGNKEKAIEVIAACEEALRLLGKGKAII